MKTQAESDTDTSGSDSEISSRESSVEIILPESRNTQPPSCPSQQTHSASHQKQDPKFPAPTWENIDKCYTDGWIKKRLEEYDKIMSKSIYRTWIKRKQYGPFVFLFFS